MAASRGRWLGAFARTIPLFTLVAPVDGTNDRGDADTARWTDSVAGVLLDRTTSLWLGAVLLYGGGDTVTTLIGLRTPHVAEAGPVVGRFTGGAEIGGLLAVKIATFAGFYLAWRVLPPPGRVGIPLALSVVGGVVTLWNLLVLLPPGVLG
jgi:hypothetical protein